MNVRMMILLLLFVPGCDVMAQLKAFNFPSLVENYGDFQQSEFIELENKTREQNFVTIRLDGVKLKQALLALSHMTGRSIVWAQELDNQACSGYFTDVPLLTVLDSISRRVGAEIMDIDGVYYLGELRPDDLATAVLPMPPGDTEQVKDSIGNLLSNRGKVSYINSAIIVRDTVEALRKIAESVNQIRANSLRRYVCELWFIRCKRADLIHIGAKLQMQNVDLLTVQNARELFKLLLEAEAQFDSVSVLQRPVLQVSEGLKGSITSGREIPLEEKAITEAGAIETTGYDLIQDGIQASVIVHRVSAGLLNCALSLEVSTFDDITSDKRPIKDSKTLTSNIILRDGEICLVGGIGHNSSKTGFALITLDYSKQKQTVLIWLRVRELTTRKSKSIKKAP